MFSRDFRRPKGAKSKHIFEIEEGKRLEIWSACLLSSCPLVQAFEASGPAGGWLWSSGGVFPPFRPLSRFALGALPTNVALFRVLRGFLARFVGFRVGLCCLGALRGLCGLCGFVRVWS